jgi:TolB protein
MNSDGSNVKRLTFAGRYNSTPNWSPDGKSLVFAGHDKDHFDVFIINIDGTGLKRLTDATKTNGRAADNRSPSFSPDGRQVLFTSNRTGQTQLYIIDTEGNNERRITYDKFEWEQPKWSPFMD